MDWGITYYIDERVDIHKTPAFIMIFGSSRAKYVEFTKRFDLYSLQKCMVNAFEYYSGIPEVVLIDRMKIVIDGSDGGKSLWNKEFEDFVADIGFVPKVCCARRPKTKGKIERLVDYVKDNFLPGRQFKDLYDLNSQAIEWCKKADSKTHSTTGKIPLETLDKESLLALLDRVICDKDRWEIRKVTRDRFVSFDGAKYGLPWQYSSREGRVRIARHKVEYASGRIVWLKGQYQGLVERSGIAMPLPFARKKEVAEVKIRSLSVYDALARVVSNA